ncbi:MAG: hypothetical protein R3B72_44335 [Polyangiaceae bacterium]
MSIETAVILKRERLPAPEDWQRALREAGFAVQLDTDFDPVEMTGFLPATYDGRPGGFEYFFSALDDSDYEPEILDRLGDRDSVVSLVTHSDFAGLMTAVLAAAALADLAGGVVHDTEADEFHDSAAALAWARKMEAEILPEL